MSLSPAYCGLLGGLAYSAGALDDRAVCPEAGFVGSSSISLMEQYHNNNTARLASAANLINEIATNTTLNVIFRVPYLGYQAVGVRGTLLTPMPTTTDCR